MSPEPTALSVRAEGGPWPAPLPLDGAASDHQLLGQVMAFYQRRLESHGAAQEFLRRRGLVHPRLVETFELGFADRQLSRSLPPLQHKAGKTIRRRLQELGLYRESGHGHFNGCLTVPIRTSSGQIADLYGRKVGRNQPKGTPLHLFLPAHGRALAERPALFYGAAPGTYGPAHPDRQHPQCPDVLVRGAAKRRFRLGRRRCRRGTAGSASEVGQPSSGPGVSADRLRRKSRGREAGRTAWRWRS